MRDPIGEGRKRLGVVLKLDTGAGMLMVCEELDMRPAIRSREPGQSREVSRRLSLPRVLMAGENLVSREEEGLVTVATPGVSIPTDARAGCCSNQLQCECKLDSAVQCWLQQWHLGGR